jgi:hypothetical protein
MASDRPVSTHCQGPDGTRVGSEHLVVEGLTEVPAPIYSSSSGRRPRSSNPGQSFVGAGRTTSSRSPGSTDATEAMATRSTMPGWLVVMLASIFMASMVATA